MTSVIVTHLTLPIVVDTSYIIPWRSSESRNEGFMGLGDDVLVNDGRVQKLLEPLDLLNQLPPMEMLKTHQIIR